MARCLTTGDGYVVIVLQTHVGAWCGYVGLPDGHPWHGLDCENTVDVHGGVTYAEPDPPSNSLVQLSLAVEVHVPSWWLGFDCAHAGNFVPGIHVGLLHGSRVWTQDDTWAEAESLLAQARAVSTG